MQLTQVIHKALREEPERVALTFQGRTTTHREFAGRVARAAAVLIAAGVKPGARVGLLAESSDRFVEALYAVWWAGGVVNPVNLRWSLPEITYSLEDSGTELMIYDDTFASAAETLKQDGGIAAILHMDALDADIAPAEDAVRRGTDLAAIMYTGGTTGRSKGVMLSHNALVSNVLSVLASAPHPGDTPSLHVAPFYHIGGLGSIIQASFRRALQVIVPAFDEAEILRQIEEHKVTDVFMVPTMVRRLLDHPDCKTRDCSSLTSIRYGAAPMDVALLADAMKAFPDAGFVHLYGQTEYAHVVSLLPPSDHTTAPDVPHMRSVGRPVIGCEVKIVDEEGQELPCGDMGEIAVRGASMMDGYWNKPEETAAAMVNGWLLTGDAGRLDENGYLYILDRIKDMVISGGENVYSTEVENALVTFDGVVMCAVIGKPDPEWGETVHAVIQTADGSALDEAALTAHCRAQIAGFKLPRSYSFVAEMPLSPAGKILKRDLRDALVNSSEGSHV